MRGFKNLVSLAVTTDYCFKEAEQMKEMILHPENFAAAAAPVAAAAAPAEEKKRRRRRRRSPRRRKRTWIWVASSIEQNDFSFPGPFFVASAMSCVYLSSLLRR